MSDKLFLATRKGLFTVKRGAAGRWSIERAGFLGDRVSQVLPDPRDGAVYAALDHGHFGPKIHRSPDGASWSECGAPAYPEQPAAREGEAPDPHKWSVDQVWSLEGGGADQPGRLWAGTIPGGLFRSEDGGASWQLIRSLWDHPQRRQWMGGGYDMPGIHSVCVDPRDSERVAVAISTGGVWITADGGRSWELRSHGMRGAYLPPEQQFDPLLQDAHRMVQCPAAPRCWWVQHHNGIFRSDDDARKWQEVTSAPLSSFGFAVAVHPRNPNVAWFVPAISDQHRVPAGGKVVVNRTENGGAGFVTLRKGLPQRHAYHLVYRHALDVDETGQRLCMGSTTGAAWISEDGGDSWREISHALPPIFVVRFRKSAG